MYVARTQEQVLYLTMRCVSDGYGDDTGGPEKRVEEEAHADINKSPSGHVI